MKRHWRINSTDNLYYFMCDYIISWSSPLASVIKRHEKKMNNKRNIEHQVERWDLYARIVPTIFLVISVILVTTGIIDFDTAFWVGLGLFAITAVTWWFWTIYTIRHLVRTLNSANEGLADIRQEFIEVTRELEVIKNDRQ